MSAHDAPTGRTVTQNAGAGLLVAGFVLLAVGGWRIGVELFDPPQALTRAVADWWALPLLLAGGWVVTQGRRTLGVAICVLATFVLIGRHVPDELVWPLIVMTAGIVVLASSFGPSRRLFDDGPGLALFDDRRVALGPGGPRTLTALFGEVEATLGDGDVDGPIECLSVFGDVDLVVPHDVAVEMRQTAVFGDVRAPEPPRGRVTRVLQVRGTSVFGDVRIRRG